METVPLLETAIIISGRQFDIFSNISAHQMLRNVRCAHHTVGICRHMNACHAPCTLYNNVCTLFDTGTSTCERNLIEACATTGDRAFIFLHILNAVLLLETVLLLENIRHLLLLLYDLVLKL